MTQRTLEDLLGKLEKGVDSKTSFTHLEGYLEEVNSLSVWQAAVIQMHITSLDYFIALDWPQKLRVTNQCDTNPEAGSGPLSVADIDKQEQSDKQARSLRAMLYGLRAVAHAKADSPDLAAAAQDVDKCVAFWNNLVPEWQPAGFDPALYMDWPTLLHSYFQTLAVNAAAPIPLTLGLARRWLYALSDLPVPSAANSTEGTFWVLTVTTKTYAESGQALKFRMIAEEIWLPECYADPSSVALLLRDSDFDNAIQLAWQVALNYGSNSKDRTVPSVQQLRAYCWRVDSQGVQVLHGDSAGAAFAVALTMKMYGISPDGKNISYAVAAALDKRNTGEFVPLGQAIKKKVEAAAEKETALEKEIALLLVHPADYADATATLRQISRDNPSGKQQSMAVCKVKSLQDAIDILTTPTSYFEKQLEQITTLDEKNSQALQFGMEMLTIRDTEVHRATLDALQTMCSESSSFAVNFNPMLEELLQIVQYCERCDQNSEKQKSEAIRKTLRELLFRKLWKPEPNSQDLSELIVKYLVGKHNQMTQKVLELTLDTLQYMQNLPSASALPLPSGSDSLTASANPAGAVQAK